MENVEERNNDIKTNSEELSLHSINKHNKFIRSAYSLQPFEQKLIYVLIDIVQQGTRQLYTKELITNPEYDEEKNPNVTKEVLEYRFKNIKYNEELSNNRAVSVMLTKGVDIETKEKIDKWKIIIEYSIEDYYLHFSNMNKQRKMSKAQFRKLIESTASKNVYVISADNDRFVKTQWYKLHGKLSEINSYTKIKLELDEYISEFIMANANFTRLNMTSLQKISGFHAMRLYEIIKEWAGYTTEKEYSVEQIKKVLDLNDKKGYENFNNLYKLLKKNIDEVAESSELNVDIVKSKTRGRKVTHIKIIIKNGVSKEKTVNENVIKEYIDHINSILNYKLTKTQHLNFYNEFKEYDFEKEYREILLKAESITFNIYNEKYKDKIAEKKAPPMKSINVKVFSIFKTTLIDLIKNKNIVDVEYKEVDKVVENKTSSVEEKITKVDTKPRTILENEASSNTMEEVAITSVYEDNSETETINNYIEYESSNEFVALEMIVEFLSEYFKEQKDITAVSFETWIKKSLENISIDTQIAEMTILMPNNFTESIFKKKYYNILVEGLKEIEPKIVKVNLKVI